MEPNLAFAQACDNPQTSFHACNPTPTQKKHLQWTAPGVEKMLTHVWDLKLIGAALLLTAKEHNISLSNKWRANKAKRRVEIGYKHDSE